MPSGFFLGGLSEGYGDARKRASEAEAREQDIGLRKQSLGVAERQIARAEQNDVIGRVDKQIADTMSVVGETIKSAVAVGRDPAAVLKAVSPLVDQAKLLASRVGRDPRAIDAQVQALTLSPTGTETATAAGKAEGTKAAVSQQTAAEILNKDQGDEAGGFIVDPAKRAEAAGKMRDDYTKLANNFTVVRDFKDRMDSAPESGAGDLSLVFSFMKILDPPSSVREGEQANASNAAGVPEAIRGMYNNLIGGGKMSPEARRQIKEAGGAAYQKAAGRYSELTNYFTALAKRSGINPKDVIVDFAPELTKPPTQKTPGGTSFRIIQ